MPLLRLLLACFLLILGALPALAQTASFDDLVRALPEGSYDDRGNVVTAMAATGDPRAVEILEALLDGNLHQLKSNDAVVFVRRSGGADLARDALDGTEYGAVPSRGSSKIKVNNGLRRVLRAAIGVLTLHHPDPSRRLAAAEAAFKAPDPDQTELLAAALQDETD